MRSAYPTALELQTELENCGLFSSAWNLDTASAVESARETWESDVDWHPYLADEGESDRRYTLRGESILFLSAGLVGAPSLITVDGNELTLGQSVFTRPLLGMPDVSTSLKFGARMFSRTDGAIIVGRWGRVIQLPETVWQAVLQRAALQLGTQIRSRKTLELVSEQNEGALIKAKASGPVRIEYQLVDGLKSVNWDATFEGWASAYSDALEGRVMRQP